MRLIDIRKKEVQLVYNRLIARGYSSNYAFAYIRWNYFYEPRTVYQILKEDLSEVELPYYSEAYKRVFALHEVQLQMNPQGLKVELGMPEYMLG